VKLISGLNNTLSVIAVHNKNEALGVLEIVPPQGPDLYWKAHKGTSDYKHTMR
jgi:hypothetical protein